MSTTFERLCNILVQQHELPPEQLTPDAPLETLGIDSLGTLELLWNVEEEFEIKLPVPAVQLSTLGDVVGYIERVVAGPGVPAITAASPVPGVPAS